MFETAGAGMQREVRMMAAALAGEFGSPQRVADEMRLFVRRADLVNARGIYFPPEERRPRPALLLDRTVTPEERSRLLVRAIAHDFLRHRRQGRYAYAADGPLYDDAREQLEAELFVTEFLARCQPQQNLAPLRARMPAGIAGRG